MGILNTIVHKSGSHQMQANSFLQPTDNEAINPINGDQFVQHNYRSAPVCREARGFSAEEADLIQQHAALNQHKVEHGIRVFKELGKNEMADAALQTAHRTYLGHVARAELQKVQANAKLGKTLHKLRPGYAAAGLSLDSAERTANSRVSVLKARIAGVLA